MIRRPLKFAFLIVRFLTPASVDANDGSLTDDELLCDVTFTLESEERTSGFVFEAAYDGASVDPLGSADAVHCATLVQNGLGAYNDEEETRILVGALVHIAGVEGRVDVAKCRFAAPEGLVPEDLSIEVHDAVDPDGAGLSALPTVFADDVVCGTAEELDEEGGGGGGGGGECRGDYEVTFGVAGDAVLGALQLSIGYTGAPGGFAGSAETADCTAEVSALALFNDIDDHKTLKAGLATTSGFETPADVVTCRFQSSGRAPVESDFVVEVEDVAYTSGEDVIPAPAAFVAAIAPVGGAGCGGEPVCGNGIVEDSEECDQGEANGTEGSACTSDCTSVTGCGDTDGNGVVSASDAARVLSDAVGLGVDCSLSLCDVNRTGSVTATDARMVLDVSVGGNVELECEAGLLVSLDDDVTLGGIELIVDYSAGSAAIVGGSDDVACTSLVDGALVSFNNDRDAKQLRAAIVALPAIDGPAPLFACAIETGPGSSDNDFVVQVLDAIAPDFSVVEDPAVTAIW